MKKEELILAGMDVEDFMNRLMNNERLVKVFVQKFLQDETYKNLISAIENGDAQAAQSACHTLKGVSGNLSLTELFGCLQEQLKLFRAGNYGKAVEAMDQITDLYDHAVYHMEKWLQEEA